MTLETMAEGLRDKKILIWGMGREGKSTYRFLRGRFPEKHLWLADQGELQAAEYREATLLQCGPGELPFSEFDLIIKSPGIAVWNLGIDPAKLTSQTQLFLQCFRSQTIGVTGTKGKSTTASLLYHVLSGCFPDVLLVGNIGVPCFDFADKVTKDTIVVFEMSCHQLEFATVSPHIAVLLNLYEDHLDHYGSYAGYVRAKENIFLHQREGDTVILNSALSEQIAKAAHPVLASKEEAADIFLDGDRIMIPGGGITVAEGDTALPGTHNRYNIAVDYYICAKLFGVSQAAFLERLKSFRGLPHRLQFVCEREGVRYYDDSISTTCQSTMQALNSLQEVGTVLIGGMDRGIDYQPLVSYLLESKVDTVILMAGTAARIAELFGRRRNGAGGRPSVVVTDTLNEAVAAARVRTPKGKICLLSPAAASYGYFKNFEERGETFQKLVTL